MKVVSVAGVASVVECSEGLLVRCRAILVVEEKFP